MIPVRTFAGKEAAVFGLARSGLSSVRALVAGGARVTAWDDNAERREAAKKAGATLLPFAEWNWRKISTLVLSPGVPLTHPAPHAVVSAAREASVEIIGDIELFTREICASHAAPVIAVTGTNGKSTTTALIGHILSACGHTARVGGNIGEPVLDLAPPDPRTIYVLEISSYQIDLAPDLAPDVSVLTNIAPDHIERHGSLENYAAVKTRLFQQTREDGLVCISVDDSHAAAIHTKLASHGGAPAVPVSAGKVLGRGIFVLDGVLYDAQKGRATEVMDLRNAAHLPGLHNWQNAALAYAACRPFVSDARAIAAAIKEFPGLPHRLEEVARIGRVRFINDSKATNADAAARALACFEDVYWIAGGRAKQGGISDLAPWFPRLRKAYLIGEAANDFARTLDGRVTYEISSTLERAVSSAFADAGHSGAADPVVLLSPACASFDQFRDFEERGDAFRSLAARLATKQVREAS